MTPDQIRQMMTLQDLDQSWQEVQDWLRDTGLEAVNDFIDLLHEGSLEDLRECDDDTLTCVRTLAQHALLEGIHRCDKANTEAVT